MENKDLTDCLHGGVALPGSYDELEVVERRNTHINSLPFDVLAVIFAALASLRSEDSNDRSLFTYPLNSVCKYWHDVVLLIPALHDRIRVQNGLPDCLSILQDYLSRSAERRLDVHLADRPRPSGRAHRRSHSGVARLLEVLTPHLWRIESLALHGFPDFHVRMLTSLPLQDAAANLERLHVCAPKLDYPPLAFFPSGSGFPNHDQSMFPRLTVLVLELEAWTARQLGGLLQFLATQPLVRHLALRELPATGSVPVGSEARALGAMSVNMADLKMLVMQNLDARRVCDVLSALQFPDTTSVNLGFGVPGGHTRSEQLEQSPAAVSTVDITVGEMPATRSILSVVWTRILESLGSTRRLRVHLNTFDDFDAFFHAFGDEMLLTAENPADVLPIMMHLEEMTIVISGLAGIKEQSDALLTVVHTLDQRQRVLGYQKLESLGIVGWMGDNARPSQALAVGLMALTCLAMFARRFECFEDIVV